MRPSERKYLLEKKNPEYGGCMPEEEEDRRTQDEEEPQDRWLVVFSSFICLCVVAGSMSSYGAMAELLMAELHQSRELVCVARSLQGGLVAVTAPVASHTVRRVGATGVSNAGAVTAAFGLLLASFGSNMVGIFGGFSILGGVGFGLMYIPAVVVVAETFITRRAFALGLSLCGMGAGKIGLAPLVGWVVGMLGWRSGLQLLAMLTMVCIGIRVQCRSMETPRQEEEADQKKPCLVVERQEDRLAVVLLVLVGESLAVLGLYSVLSVGAPDPSTLLEPATVLCSMAGCLVSGWVADQGWIHPLHLSRAVLALSCPLPVLLAWVNSAWLFILLSCILGFLTGAWIAATSPLLVSLLGLHNLGKCFGLITAVLSVAPLTGLLIADPLQTLCLSSTLLCLSVCVFSAASWAVQRKGVLHVGYQHI